MGCTRHCLSGKIHSGGYALPALHLELCSPGRRKSWNPPVVFMVFWQWWQFYNQEIVGSFYLFVNICYSIWWFLPALGFCPELILLGGLAVWCIENCTRKKENVLSPLIRLHPWQQKKSWLSQNSLNSCQCMLIAFHVLQVHFWYQTVSFSLFLCLHFPATAYAWTWSW